MCDVLETDPPLSLSGGASTLPACPPCPCPLSRASLGGPVLTILLTIPYRTIPYHVTTFLLLYPPSSTFPPPPFFYIQKGLYKLRCSGWLSLWDAPVTLSSTLTYMVFWHWPKFSSKSHGRIVGINTSKYLEIPKKNLKIFSVELAPGRRGEVMGG